MWKRRCWTHFMIHSRKMCVRMLRNGVKIRAIVTRAFDRRTCIEPAECEKWIPLVCRRSVGELKMDRRARGHAKSSHHGSRWLSAMPHRFAYPCVLRVQAIFMHLHLTAAVYPCSPIRRLRFNGLLLTARSAKANASLEYALICVYLCMYVCVYMRTCTYM